MARKKEVNEKILESLRNEHFDYYNKIEHQFSLISGKMPKLPKMPKFLKGQEADPQLPKINKFTPHEQVHTYAKTLSLHTEQLHTYTDADQLQTRIKILQKYVNDLHEYADRLQTYAKRVYEWRENCGYTQEKAGAKLGVVHTTIDRIESEGVPINEFYIEAFSLLYHVSPLYLLSETDDSGYIRDDEDGNNLTDLMRLPEPHIMYKAHLIVQTLYQDDKNFELNQRLLNVFAKICAAKREMDKTIENKLLDMPIIEKLTKSASIEDKINPKDFRTLDKENRRSFSEASDKTWNEFCDFAMKKGYYSIYDFLSELTHLGESNPDLLDLLARISLGNTDAKELTCSIVEKGGFLSRPNSFSKNAQVDFSR